MLKNKCGADIGDIWRLGSDGEQYLLIRLKTHEEDRWLNGDEDTFQAIQLSNGIYETVFFSHHNTMGWQKVA